MKKKITLKKKKQILFYDHFELFYVLNGFISTYLVFFWYKTRTNVSKSRLT